MNKRVKLMLHYGRRIATICGKLVSSVIPKDKNLILFSSWFSTKYSDSPMFMFEYFLRERKNKRVVWYTRNIDLFNKLKAKKIPTVYGHSIKGLWFQLRSIMMVSTVEFYDFNFYFFSKCILLDLDHGFPVKQSGYEIPTISARTKRYDLLLRKGVKFYKTASSAWVKDIIKRTYSIDEKGIAFCNKPRTDVFFDEELRVGKNEIVNKIKNGRKAILYAPTQRSAGKVKMDISKIFDLDTINNFCEKIDAVFLVKKHFYHYGEVEDLGNYPRIFDITNEDVETQTLLYQSDLLISDYSAIYIDYLLLNRPILLYAFDYEDYLKTERELYIKFEDISVGYKSFNFNELMSGLKQICTDWLDVEHEEGRKQIKFRYFDSDVAEGNAREQIAFMIDKMIEGTYKPKWAMCNDGNK